MDIVIKKITRIIKNFFIVDPRYLVDFLRDPDLKAGSFIHTLLLVFFEIIVKYTTKIILEYFFPFCIIIFYVALKDIFMHKKNKPLISPDKDLKEFTLRALFTGIVFAIIFGFSNAYLGLKSGITIAATYPAAILGIEFLRHRKQSNILEENLLRNVGSIGEAVAGGKLIMIKQFIRAFVLYRILNPL